MVETVVEAVRVNVVNDQHVVVLKEVNGARVIPIWVTEDIARSIAYVLQGAEMPRPLTHDLIRSIIEQMGGEVSRVVVSDLKDQIFHGLIEIEADGKRLEIDSRSSDAVALAVRSRCPIYVEDHVMEQAGLVLPTETEESRPASGDEQALDPNELERLNVFRNFVNSMEDPKREGD